MENLTFFDFVFKILVLKKCVKILVLKKCIKNIRVKQFYC